MKKLGLVLALSGMVITLTSCSTYSSEGFKGFTTESKCQYGLSQAYYHLQNPSRPNQENSLVWVQAANLISQAKLDQAQRNYDGCLSNLHQALELFKQSPGRVVP